MRTFRLTLPITALGLALAIGCGGGGGGGSTSTVPGPAVSQGVISALGSIVVNGTEYNVADAIVVVDDNPASAADLWPGMVVKVRGSSDDRLKTGTATRVEARSALRGTIDSIDAANHTITVMGQVVQLEDNVTRLFDNDFFKVFGDPGFQLTDKVEVHGFPDDTGRLRATRVAAQFQSSASNEFQAKGYIVQLTANSFGLSLTPGGAGFITVDFSSGLLPAGAVEGSLVEVHSAAAPAAGVVTASAIELEDALAATGEKVQVQGAVSSGTVADFFINGREVVTSAATVFKGGTAADFALGAVLEAEGSLNAAGVLAASEIYFSDSIKIEGDASAVVPGSSLAVIGQAVNLSPLTRIVGALADGAHVQVRARFDRNDELLAVRVNVLGGSSNSFLQGTVSGMDLTNNTVTILGLPFAFDAGSQFRLSSTTGEAAVAPAAFLAALVPNVTVVKIKWNTTAPGSSPFKEAEIEEGK